MVAEKEDKRRVLGVGLTIEAQERLDEAADRLMLKKKDLLEVLLTWFSKQEDVVQRLIVGHIPPEVAGSAAEIILARLAGKEPPPKPASRSRPPTPAEMVDAARAEHERQKSKGKAS